MIQLLLIEKNLKKRKEFLNFLKETFTAEACISVFKDRIDVMSGDLDDVNATCLPSIIIIGEDSAKNTPELIAKARNRFNKATIIVLVEKSTLENLKHYTLYGAHNVIGYKDSESILFGCLLSSLSKNDEIKRGKLILIDSGKGGVGTTTLAASFAAFLNDNGLKVTLIDLDYESQDLCRFFRVRPFLSDTLESLLTQGNFISLEQVSQCCQKVWQEESLEVVPPAPALEGLVRGNQNTLRQFRLVLEVIDSRRDVVVVDLAGLPSSAARKLYDVADNIIYLLSLDPSTVHASLARLKAILNMSNPDYQIHLLPISTGRDGISSNELVSEFERCLKVKGGIWSKSIIPYSKTIRHWPSSGISPVEFGGRNYLNAIAELSSALELYTGRIDNKFINFQSFENITMKISNYWRKNKTSRNILFEENTNSKLLPLTSTPENCDSALITKPSLIKLK